MTRGRLALLMTGLVALWCLTAGEDRSGAAQPPSVAVAAGTLITASQFDHWESIAGKEEETKTQSQTGKSQVVIVPDDPPLFTNCIAQARKLPSLPTKASSALRADCRKIFGEYKNEVLSYLIDAYWYEADAARLGIVYTHADLTTAFDKAKAREFPTNADLASYLKASGETLADVRFQIQINAIYSKLLDVVGGRTKPAAEKNLTAQVTRLYRGHTFCKPLYEVADCSPKSSFSGSMPPLAPPKTSLPGKAPTFNVMSRSATALVRAISNKVRPAGSTHHANQTCDLYPGNGADGVLLVVSGTDATAICSTVGDRVFAGVVWSTSGSSFPTPGSHVHSDFCTAGSTKGADSLFIDYTDNVSGDQNSFVLCDALTKSSSWQIESH